MARAFRTYFEDFGRVGTKSGSEKRSDMHSHFDDEDSEQEVASSADYLDIPSSRPRSIPRQRSSEPIPIDRDEFLYEASQYTPSETSSGLPITTQEPFPRDRWYHHEGAEQKLEECQRLMEENKKRLGEIEEEKKIAYEKAQEEKKIMYEEAQVEIESLKIRLFHSVKAAKNYDEAEKLYHEIVTDKELSMSDDPRILDIRHSFADMLVEQEMFDEAEPISRAVWEKRRDSSDFLSQEAKQSYRQLCLVLCSLQKFEEAEMMCRTMYHKASKDAWALENGDEVCQILAKQQQYEKAKTMQHDLWKERRRQLGHRNELTIRSGVRVIEFLERLMSSIGSHGSSGAQQRFIDHRKKAFEVEYEVMLGDVWETRAAQEQNIQILDAGHKLGTIHFLRAEFDTAGSIFESVWEGRKTKFGENNASTLATGSMLGKALRYQGTPEAIPRAIDILKGVWLARRSTLKPTDAETIVSGEELAQLYFSVSDLANAEPIYKWIVDQKSQNHGRTAPATMEARWNLGQILFEQGTIKVQEAQNVLGELYNHWKLSSPRSGVTSRCGYMLAHSLSTQDERSSEALDIIRGVFNRNRAMGDKDSCDMDSGRLYGLLLLKVEDFPEAEKVLQLLWEHQGKEPGELSIRLTCGNLYGQCLSLQHKYLEAREILESVAEIQKTYIPAGNPQVAETHELLANVSERIQEIDNKKNQKEKRASRPIPKKRGGIWG